MRVAIVTWVWQGGRRGGNQGKTGQVQLPQGLSGLKQRIDTLSAEIGLVPASGRGCSEARVPTIAEHPPPSVATQQWRASKPPGDDTEDLVESLSTLMGFAIARLGDEGAPCRMSREPDLTVPRGRDGRCRYRLQQSRSALAPDRPKALRPVDPAQAGFECDLMMSSPEKVWWRIFRQRAGADHIYCKG